MYDWWKKASKDHPHGRIHIWQNIFDNFMIILNTEGLYLQLQPCISCDESRFDYNKFSSVFFIPGHINNTSFLLQLTNGPKTFECLFLASLSSLVQCNTLAYWAIHKLRWKINGVNSTPGAMFTTLYVLRNLWTS